MEACGLCGKPVYTMERIRAINQSWHKLCFKCTECGTILGLKNHESAEGKPYCKVHLPKATSTAVADSISMETARSAPKAVLESGVHKPSKPDIAAKPGRGRGGPAPRGAPSGRGGPGPARGGGAATPGRFGGSTANNCPVCQQKVFPTEEVKAINQHFHKHCFKCKECGMSLNLKNMQSFEGILYCQVHLPKVQSTAVTDDINTTRALNAPKTKMSAGVDVTKDLIYDGTRKVTDASSASPGGPPAPAPAAHHEAPAAHHEAPAAHHEEPAHHTPEAAPEHHEAPHAEPAPAHEEEYPPPPAEEGGDVGHDAGIAPEEPTGEGAAAQKCRALFEYEVQEEGELGFPEGAVITITGYPSDDWWTGEYEGNSGMFPSNYVEVIAE